MGGQRIVSGIVSMALCWLPFGRASLLQPGAVQPPPVIFQAGGTPGNVRAAAPGSNIATIPVDGLHSALDQVVSALGQVETGRWKVSREWKRQLREDADSIQQDISSQLPALFAKAKAVPGQIGPQLAVMQNVDALYDVLVRVTTAANLAGGKSDAGVLESALQQLESSRKSVSAQIQQAAGTQDQRVVQLQAQAQQAIEQSTAAVHAKTIIVDDGVRRRPKHHKAVPRKKASTTKESPNPKPPAPN